ncbi:hypothetical protein DFH06DRAFT_1312600 [Mycena polygramma]|nr:hypothetical protein DFH06DRAFT_1312600 [Mycena polygramma]
MNCLPNPYLPGSLHGLLEVPSSRSPSPDMAQAPNEQCESTERDSSDTGIVLRRRTGAWPRLTPSDSALIRFLLSNGVSRADIHNNLGWSASTIVAHGAQKNKGAVDQKLVNAKFYEILDKSLFGSPYPYPWI